MRDSRKRFGLGLLLALVILTGWKVAWAAIISENTQECIACHSEVTPGIVADWKNSRHALASPTEAMQNKGLGRKVTGSQIPKDLTDRIVGCAECHLLNDEQHKDSFDHNGFRVHPVVTPTDCGVCHTQEMNQYQQNLMAHAYGNLMANPVYQDLLKSIVGTQTVAGTSIQVTDSSILTREDSCLSCHGTQLEVHGAQTLETPLGEMEFPVLSGWPNNGVGRLNPDGSKGSCASCHARHRFSIAMARKAETCSQCHKGPDVPSYGVYTVSKHGNIYAATKEQWNFMAVPWTVGKDFNAPTCATCHMSLLVDGQQSVIARRTHQVSDRLGWRILGLIYAHPHPKSPDTSSFRNSDGLPLPTDFNGQWVASGLIDEKEQARRRDNMQAVCKACHSTNWVQGHWARFENTIKTTNEMTHSATKIMQYAWTKGLAHGLAQKQSPFDEAVEKMWIEQWLFFGNSIRFSSAMLGADYGVFANGRWYQSRNLRQLQDWVDVHLSR